MANNEVGLDEGANGAKRTQRSQKANVGYQGRVEREVVARRKRETEKSRSQGNSKP